MSTSTSTTFHSFSGSPSSTRALDLVVFGASGFTGRHVVKELVRVQDWISSELGRSLKWAVVGRSRDRLQVVLNEFGVHVPVIEADVYQYSSLLDVAKQTSLLLNCVGPFRYFGGPVVQACVDAQTNYCDITGEPDFIDRMFMAHHEEAVKANILVVPACGFDSMPADLGVLFTKAKMISAGVIPAHIEMFLSIKSGRSGFCGHYATFESLVQGFSAIESLRSMRKTLAQMRPRVRPITDIPLRLITRPSYQKKIAGYTVPFPGSDASVVRMGQEVTSLLQLHDGLPAVHFNAYMAVRKWTSMAGIVVFGALISAFTRYRVGRWLLLKFPRFFTLGMFSHNGPTPEQMAATSFQETFFGHGYALGDNSRDLMDHVLRATDPIEFECARNAVAGRPLDTLLVTTVKGPEPGYVATPLFLIAAAISILAEKKSSNLPCGVLTPASAFYRSNIITRLRTLGIDFSVLSGPEAKL